MKSSIVLISIVSLICSLVRAEFFPPTSAWENVNYTRIIDLSRSYARESHNLKIKNVQLEPLQTYYFVLPTADIPDLTLIVPTLETGGRKILLNIEEVDDTFGELTIYKIELPFPIAAKLSVEFQISTVFSNQVSPLPELVEHIDEFQSLIYYTSKLPITIYPTFDYTLKFIGFENEVDEVPVKGIAFDDEMKGAPVKELLVYGPYDLSKEPVLTPLPMALLFKRRAPLMHVNKLTRDIWISHLSELLQVEEHYQLTNKGVALKNGFNRVEYMQKKMAMKLNPLINSIEIPLYDSDTTDIYYTDLVGNVSTSMIIDSSLLLKPRFPLFGGWNYNFTIGWTNPIGKYVHNVGEDEYLLSVPIVSGPRDCSYSKLEFNVLLPAGANVIAVESPVEYTNYQVGEFYSYLDTLKGHKKISFEVDNLVDEMKNINVLVKYSYTKIDLFAKVISISIYIFVALISFIGIKLIDIRIDTNKKKLI